VHRHQLVVPLFACCSLLAVPAFAAPKDKSADKMIDKAVNEHYLATDFKKAESVLLGTVKACGDECSASVLGRAWMYVGIVRGNGRKNQKTARQAFDEALKADPGVKLDTQLATDETKATFAKAAKAAGVEFEGAAEPEADADAEIDLEADAEVDLEAGAEAPADEDEPAAPGAYAKNWVGLHFGLDMVGIGGSDLCAPGTEGDTATYACFFQDTEEYFYWQTIPGSGGSIGSTFVRGTMRLMASYDRALLDNVSAGVRVGYAFGGGPQPASATAFLPLHFEVRGTYWFGANPFAKEGLRPYVHVGGGVAQVDAKVPVQVRAVNPNDGNSYILNVDAWQKLGTGFVTAGGGLAFALSPTLALQANLNAMLMLGNSGFVIQPSLGAVTGF